MKGFVIAVISSQVVPTELLALGWKELFSNTSFLLPNEFQLTCSSVASFLSARVRKGEIGVWFGGWRGAVLGASFLLLGLSGCIPACTSSQGCCDPNPQAQSIPGEAWLLLVPSQTAPKQGQGMGAVQRLCCSGQTGDLECWAKAWLLKRRYLAFSSPSGCHKSGLI